MSLILKSGSSQNVADVTSNAELKVILPTSQITTLSDAGISDAVSPTTGAQITNHTNSSSPVSATLSNTAAGYTTLGGRFQWAGRASAATDFALFGYQVPVGYTLKIKSVNISLVNTGAANGTTAQIFDWGLGLDGSAVSLATVEAPPSTYAPKRVPLGVQAIPASSAIGYMPQSINVPFPAALVCNSGRFLTVILQIFSGVATTNQIIRGDCVINGYFV